PAMSSGGRSSVRTGSEISAWWWSAGSGPISTSRSSSAGTCWPVSAEPASADTVPVSPNPRGAPAPLPRPRSPQTQAAAAEVHVATVTSAAATCGCAESGAGAGAGAGARRAAQGVGAPPVTESVLPVVYDDSSDARYTYAPAISTG